jgi:hypothetical protein
MTCSLGEDFEDPTASTWVGYEGWVEVGRIGMESEGGSWDFDMEVGIDNAAIPASILHRQNALVSHTECINDRRHTDMLLVEVLFGCTLLVRWRVLGLQP